jgi:hypothetical protein
MKSNHFYLSLEEFGKASAKAELYSNPIIEIVQLKGNDGIVFAQENNYMSCYYGRKSYGFLWRDFTGIGVLREVDDVSDDAIETYKQECIKTYEINHMENY